MDRMSEHKHRVAVKALIYHFGLMYNQEVSEEKINAYTSVLAKLSLEEIKYAFEKILRSGSAFFPSVGEIFKVLMPENVDESPIIATEIISLIRNYGKYSENEMMLNASPLARAVLNQLGSTDQIRYSENVDTVRAQLERLARAIQAKENRISHENELNLIGEGRMGLKRLFGE